MSLGDDFDFSEMIFGEPTKLPEKEEAASDPAPTKKETPAAKGKPTSYDTEVQSSYLLVNALLNLLIRKQLIYPHEVQALVAELHVDYMKKKKGRDTDGDK
jgi:hypothetical protein